MERETIKLTQDEIINLMCEGALWIEDGSMEGITTHIVVDEEMLYLDLEKSYKETLVTFERLNDQKYFQFQVQETSQGIRDYSEVATEVFPEQITTTIYK